MIASPLYFECLTQSAGCLPQIYTKRRCYLYICLICIGEYPINTLILAQFVTLFRD